MSARLETWQLAQLQRMANCEPEKVEGLLNTLWSSHPGLFDELAIAAIDQEMLTVDEGSKLLSLNESEIEERLLEYRQRSKNYETVVIHDEMRKAACLSQGGIPVWEVVLEYRKLGSVDMLKAAFPSLTEGDLTSALKYAETHSEEIEHCISDYELIRARRKAEYPFSR